MDKRETKICDFFPISKTTTEHPRYFQMGIHQHPQPDEKKSVLELILKETNNQLKLYLTPWKADIIY